MLPHHALAMFLSTIGAITIPSKASCYLLISLTTHLFNSNSSKKKSIYLLGIKYFNAL